ncbi:MAG: hypothetical protein M3033_03620 [Acidobacteriota bacterium]|nr:hypothetical protein [Acidobacteriota bacterium]
MKKILIAAFMLIQLFTVSIFAQQRKPQKQTAPRTMKFKKWEDYSEKLTVNSTDAVRKRHLGERLIIPDAPPMKKISSQYLKKNLYSIQSSNDGMYFLTSPAMAKDLRPHLKSNAASWRVTGTLVEIISADISFFPYATKIEGLDANGAVIWTATGIPPPHLTFEEEEQ